jgi:hypothetical protein
MVRDQSMVRYLRLKLLQNSNWITLLFDWGCH